MDLFGELTPEEKAAQEQKKKEEEAKKAKKEEVGRSQIVYDIKPWGEDTDMAELEKAVRAVERPGLQWMGSQLKDVAYGVKKLVIICNVEDTVDTDGVQEELEGIEDYIQSVDIVSFNKL